MTGVTRWNKTVVPAGGDGWNLTPDLGKALDGANVIVPVASASERNALTPPQGLYAGMAVARQDLGGLIEVLDPDQTTWTRGIQHSEFTGSTVPDIPTTSPTWGTGPLTRDTNQDRNGGIFTSPANDKISLPGGSLYAISVRVKMSVNSTGKSWVALTDDSNSTTYTSYDIQPGASTGAISIPNFYVKNTQNIRVVFFSDTAAGYTLTSRIRVSRVG